MFILRIIQEDRQDASSPFEQVIDNFELGSCYAVLKKGHTTEFDKIMKSEYPEASLGGIEGIICGQNDLKFFVEKNTALRERSYFVMTESGKTFEKV